MKIFFILGLGVVLLLKQSLGETKNPSTSNELTPNGKAFRNAVIAKIVTLSEEPLKLGKQLFENAYADESNSENVTTALAGTLSDFDTDQFKTPAGAIDTFLGLGLLCDVVTNRMNISGSDMGRKLLPLKEVLQKQDVMTVANEFHRKFDEFLEWLTQEYEAKHDKLTSEEQLRVKALKELWVQFKDDTNFQKKLNAYRAITRSVK